MSYTTSGASITSGKFIYRAMILTFLVYLLLVATSSNGEIVKLGIRIRIWQGNVLPFAYSLHYVKYEILDFINYSGVQRLQSFNALVRLGHVCTMHECEYPVLHTKMKNIKTQS